MNSMRESVDALMKFLLLSIECPKPPQNWVVTSNSWRRTLFCTAKEIDNGLSVLPRHDSQCDLDSTIYS